MKTQLRLFLVFLSALLAVTPVVQAEPAASYSISDTVQDVAVMVAKTATQTVIYLGAAYLAIKWGVNYAIEQTKEPDFKVYQPGEIKESFASIAGYHSEKQLFKDIVEYLKNPQKYEALGAQPSKGILLTGAPGTGKTMLVRALAGEANCSFIYACGADCVGSERIKKIFEQAKAEQKPCIIFFDEFEILVPTREKSDNPSVITFLTELDGFIKNQNYPIIVIAATNFPGKIDPAILRPGRINRNIHIQLPSMADRKAILQVHLNKVTHEEGIDLSSLAQLTEGFTGAQLAEIVQSATRIAVNNNQSCITLYNLEEALDIEQIGVISARRPNAHEQKVTAYHEAGHALISILTQPRIKLTKITIVVRGDVGGITQFVQVDEEENLSSKEDFLNLITVGLGGRAAEEIIFNLVSTGPSSDLAKTTSLAKNMVKYYGMGDNLLVGDMVDGQALNGQINAILNSQYQRALALLRDNIDGLHRIAQALLEKETLYSDEIYELVRKS